MYLYCCVTALDVQILVGASQSNELGSVKYIINHAKNLDINVRESGKVSIILHQVITIIIFLTYKLFIDWLDCLDVGH